MSWNCRRIVESSHDSIMDALRQADGFEGLKSSHFNCLLFDDELWYLDHPENILGEAEGFAKSLWKRYSSRHTQHELETWPKEFLSESATVVSSSTSTSYLFKFKESCTVEVNRPKLYEYNEYNLRRLFRTNVINEVNDMYKKNPRTSITKLILHDEDTLVYSHDSFDEINITELHIGVHGVIPYNLEKLKNCNIVAVGQISCCKSNMNQVSKLKIVALNLKSAGVENQWVECIKLGVTENIAYLDLNHCSSRYDDHTEFMKSLTEALMDSNVISLNLSYNSFDSDCAKQLAKVLPHTKITYIDLHGNSIGYKGYTYLMEVIERTDICWLSLSENNIERRIKDLPDLCLYIVPRNKTPFVFQMRLLFKELVTLNTSNDTFEFIVPKQDSIMHIKHYSILIAYLLETPFSKNQIYDIFYMINKMHDILVMNRVIAFISRIEQKFLSFFETNLSELELRFGYDSFVDLVREFRNLKLSDIVDSLLYHRVLYYVDDAQNILHPLIYKELHEHKMPLFNEMLEPNKKQEILSYFEKHSEFEGVQELIDLLDYSEGGEQCKKRKLELGRLE